jgi:hypothetical protein
MQLTEAQRTEMFKQSVAAEARRILARRHEAAAANAAAQALWGALLKTPQWSIIPMPHPNPQFQEPTNEIWSETPQVVKAPNPS